MKVGDKVLTRYQGPGVITDIEGDRITVKTQRVMLGRNCVNILDRSDASHNNDLLKTGNKRPWTVTKVTSLKPPRK